MSQKTGIFATENFKIHSVDPHETKTAVAALAAALPAASSIDAPLGPLSNFVGTWRGFGFNTIFRPSQPAVSGSDNVLQLNLTTEVLSFSDSLGSIPNRGENQPDIFLNGVPYLQTVNDVTTPGQSTGIHFEPGIWLSVPSTTDPAVPTPSFVRMASIPHGTSLLAQGTSSSVAGPPTIPSVDITPTFIAGGGKIPFPSQTASDPGTFRIPKVLPVPGTTLTVDDWDKMLKDPNSFIRDAIAGQTISDTTMIAITTDSVSPLVGGGTSNMAFLLGNPNPNANAVKMTATFFIETVQFDLAVPVMLPGTTITLAPATTVRNLPMPQFSVTAVSGITAPTTVPVTYNQIQYTQNVALNFAPLSWPHVSVATLVPAAPIAVTVP